MNLFNRTLTIIFLIISLVSVPGFSQNVDSATKKEELKTEESSKSKGLRKIPTRSHRDLDFDIRIDHEELEATIETAIKNAMRSVEATLEKLEIHIEPIEINLGNLNLDMDPIVVNLPELNIDIEPIEIDLDDLDIDIDHDNFDWNDHDDDDEWDDNEDNDDDRDQEKVKEKHKFHKEESIKDKSDKIEKDKAKGLKKIN